MTNDRTTTPNWEVSTRELAKMFKVKTQSIHHAYWLHGHYRGWEPCGHVEAGHEYQWHYVGAY